MATAGVQAQLTEPELKLLQALVYQECGMHFDSRRADFLQDRLQRRLKECQLDSFYSYYRLLISKEGKEELARLLENLTVNETSFFRNKAQLDLFHKHILDDLLRRKQERKDFSLRLWSAGCSTGQEAYTMAMQVADGLSYHVLRNASTYDTPFPKPLIPPPWRLEILASDISYSVLRAGQEGIYTESQMASVDYSYRLRHFDKIGDRYAVKKPLKELVHFDFHNLKTEYLPQRNDVIFCRNVMMYFDEAEQKRLVEKFYRCLNPGGYLFVGHAESLLGLTDKFNMIYRETGTAYQQIEVKIVTQFPDERAAELKELFFETAQELLQSLNEETLRLEKKPGDLETVRSIRRIVHTLKGDSAAVGFHELSELAHELEDALALEAGAALASLAEVAFSTADTFSAMLNSYRSGSKLPTVEPVRKMIRKLARDPKARKSKTQAASSSQVKWTEYEKLATQGALKQGKNVYHITAQIDPNCAMPIAAQQLILKALSDSGEVLGTRPEAGAALNAMQFQLLLASNQTAEYLIEKCRIPTITSQVKIESVGAAEQKAAKAMLANAPVAASDVNPAVTNLEPKSASEPAEAAEETVPPLEHEPAVKPNLSHSENVLRVDAERIDNVLNLVGELIIGKSMLQQALNEFAVHYPKEALRGRFADAMAFQSRVLNDLQRSVMKVRMVPVEQLFRRFPRMVRDVAKQCGKQVELVLNGQDTALDKTLLDAIAEPLTHLVRNAIGHGIEGVEERTRGGKPAHGTIRLEAYHQGNQVIVEISDDGRGIDAQKVRKRAIERRLLKPEEANRLSEADILDFIFRPGFSTADEITELSGRGVGLDVVQSVLHRLKGTVHVTSHSGQGSTFRLQLPLTLAIIKALLFRVEQSLYAIPLNAVAEIARARESDIHRVDNCEVLQLRDRALPLARLGRPPQDSEGRLEKVFVLVIAMGERKLGLLVNAIEGEEELVIKALDERTAETDLVSGASILGNGHVVLILNLAAIIERFSQSRPDTFSGPGMGLLLSHSERARFAQGAAGGRP